MSDLLQLRHDKIEIPEKFMQPYLCTWMAHWMRASCGSSIAARKQVLLSHESREENRCTKHDPLPMGQEIGVESSRIVKELRDISKGKMIDLMDENVATSWGKQRDDTFEGSASVILKLPQNHESILALEKGECSKIRQYLPSSQVNANFAYDESLGGIQNHSSSLFALASSGAEIQSAECCLQPEGISLTPTQQVKLDKLLEKTTLAVLPCFPESSKIMPYQSNSMPPMHPFFSHCSKKRSGAALAAHQKKADTSATLLVHDPSIDTDQLRDLIVIPFRKTPKHSEVELFPSQISPPDTGKFESSHHRSYGPTRMPSSVHDLETMRICTTIDSVKKYLKVPQKSSQTTHQFFFARKTDVNLFDGGQVFRKSILTASEGKKVDKFPCLSPDFTFHIKQGLKLQPLGGFIESARKEDAEQVKTTTRDLKNELIIETDTMDMDAFQKSHLFGLASSQSNKDIKGVQKPLTSDTAVASARGEIRSKHVNTEIPDMNRKLPTFSGLTSSRNDTETTITRTQSWDVENLLSHAAHPTNLKASDGSDGSLGLDPRSRWVKRLKSSASDSSAYGTKSSRMEEASLHDKFSKLSSKVLKCTKTTSEQKMSESNHKDQKTVDPTVEELRKAEFSSIHSGKKSEDVKLLHAWIQRWCHGPAASTEEKSEMVMDCMPHRSNLIPDIEKKQHCCYGSDG